MHLCPGLKKLSSKDWTLTSDDLILLLDKLKHFQHSSSNVCSWLNTWNLHGNSIDDNDMIALMQCQLFPRMYRGCQLHAKLVLTMSPVVLYSVPIQ